MLTQQHFLGLAGFEPVTRVAMMSQSLMIYGWQILDRNLLEFFFHSESAPKVGSEVLSNSDSTSEKILWTNFEMSNLKFKI